MKAAVFAHPNGTLPEKTLLPDKVELFSKLRDRDVEPIITFDGEQAFSDVGVEAHRLMSETTTVYAGKLALEQVGMVVNRLDRAVRFEDMPSAFSELNVPIENENTLRSLVREKHRVQEELLAPLNLGMDTRLVESVTDALVFAQLHPSANYIIKPTHGTFSKGVETVAAADVASFLAASDKLGGLVMQPAYDFSIPLPASMRPYDSESADSFEMWARSNATKELRMYGFYTPSHTEVFPVGRAMVEGEDHWFYLDPESVPDTLFETTDKVLTRAAELTGSRAIYAALDVGYGTYSPDTEPGYHIVELNGRMPYMISAQKHAGVANVLRDAFADQIQSTVYGATDRVE